MKITFDTSAFWESGLSYEEIYHTVAEAGYKYVSPYNQDFPGFWRRPKFTMKEVEWHKKAIEAEGLEEALDLEETVRRTGKIMFVSYGYAGHLQTSAS